METMNFKTDINPADANKFIYWAAILNGVKNLVCIPEIKIAAFTFYPLMKSHPAIAGSTFKYKFKTL